MMVVPPESSVRLLMVRTVPAVAGTRSRLDGAARLVRDRAANDSTAAQRATIEDIDLAIANAAANQQRGVADNGGTGAGGVTRDYRFLCP